MIKISLFLVAVTLSGAVHAAQSDPEQTAIEQVLTNYRTAVNTGDEALFSTTLLDDDLPFTGVTERTESQGVANSAALRDVASFRRGIFHSGQAYEQSFDHMEIVRHDGLAQASFHWVTRLKDKQGGGEGWKAITLLKIKGQWKIAAEFYTAGPLKTGS